ncbi:MAG TPA: hypothetical protein VF606_02645, partial [Geminicoccaceae bacterium]
MTLALPRPVPGRLASGLLDREASVLLLARLAQNANGFLLSVLLVRQFGLAAAGTATVATIAITALALLGTAGLPFSLAREGAGVAERNATGLAASALVVPLALPAIALYAWLASRGVEEAVAVGLLALGGLFFAQVNVLNALLVLQGRVQLSFIPPLANLAGLGVAAATASSLAGFAAVLALFRLAGVAMVYARLDLAPVAPRAVLARVRAGAAFLTTDAINLGSDQLVLLLVSYLLPREALGLVGLCRQLMTVAETPGWSLVQSRYPELVSRAGAGFPHLRGRIVRLSLLCSAVTLPAAWLLGTQLYEAPALCPLAVVFAAALPARDLGNLYEQTMRALGAVRSSNQVAALRFAVAVVALPAAAAI